MEIRDYLTRLAATKSWSRGIMARGLIVTLLEKAACEPGFKDGQEINEGQLLISVSGELANDLKASRKAVRTLLEHLQDDFFIKVENWANRQSLITVEFKGGQQTENTKGANQGPTRGQPRANQGPTKGQPKSEIEAEFDQFWAAYPRQVARGKAKEKYLIKRRDDTMPPLPILLAAIEAQKQGQAWLNKEEKYIPHPATWLNQERWADKVKKVKTYDDIATAVKDSLF